MRTAARTLEYNLPKLFWLFCALFALSASLYLYYVNTTVLSIVSTNTAQAQITDLKSELSQLESRYIALEQSLTAEEATRIGLVQTEKVTFLDPRISAQALSLRDGI